MRAGKTTTTNRIVFYTHRVVKSPSANSHGPRTRFNRNFIFKIWYFLFSL